MSAIVDIIGREVIDSRGNPTVRCDVLLESGVMDPCCCAFRCLHRFARNHRTA